MLVETVFELLHSEIVAYSTGNKVNAIGPHDLDRIDVNDRIELN